MLEYHVYDACLPCTHIPEVHQCCDCLVSPIEQQTPIIKKEVFLLHIDKEKLPA